MVNTTFAVAMCRRVGRGLCLLVALMASASEILAGPLSSTNMQIYDDGVPVGGLTYAPGGAPGGWSLIVTGTSTNFSFTAVIGTSNQPGGPFGANLQTSQVSVKATGPGSHTFSIKFSDKNFVAPVGSMITVVSSGSVTFTGATINDSATLQTFFDSGNNLFGNTGTTGLQSATSTSISPNSTSFGAEPATGEFPGNPLFSLTSNLSVTLKEQGAEASLSSSAVATFRVPEPGTIVVLGMSVAGLAALRFARRRRPAVAI